MVNVFTGKGKGRAIRALTRTVAKLATEDPDESNLLKRYEGKCKLAQQLRDSTFASLTWSDLCAILKMLDIEEVELPMHLARKIIEKRVKQLLKSGSLEDSCQSMGLAPPPPSCA